VEENQININEIYPWTRMNKGVIAEKIIKIQTMANWQPQK
jgi:hypothetical protein